MSTLAIDKAIEKVPFLSESKNIKKTPLSGGITNLNFKIDADGKAFVIRLAGRKSRGGAARHSSRGSLFHKTGKLHRDPFCDRQSDSAGCNQTT